jgi:protease-4
MRDFIKYVLASLVGLILFVTFGVGALVVLIVSAASRDSGPKVEENSMLVLDLSVEIQDTQPASTTSEAIEQALSDDDAATIALRTVLQTLEKAAEDDRIAGLYIKGRPGSTTTGYATLREVRRALEAFKNTDKTIIAYDRDWSEREYYLASIADELLLDPMGTLQINGLSSQTAYFADALEQYGIGAQVVRVGEYKSAVEPFVRNDRSDESTEQTQALLEDLWRDFLASAARHRPIEVAQFQTLANESGIILADRAVEGKFVDRAAYSDEVIEQLQELSEMEEDKASFRQIDIGKYARATEIINDGTSQRSSDNQIAIVYANGAIVAGEGTVNQVGGERFAKQLRELQTDEDVKAVVLRVNSPGGSALASEVIRQELANLREDKPVIVSMGNVAASGGYWISMDADRIFAEPSTITGSIGVFGLLINVQEIANENGISWDIVKTSPYADSATISRPKSEEELENVRQIVNEIYDRFITKVSETRDIDKQRVNEIARGRVWSGVDAKEVGLVDELGGLDAAIAAAAETAELGDDWQVEDYPKTRTLEQRILENLFGTQNQPSGAITPSDPLTAEWKQWRSRLREFQAMNDPRGIYLRLPYQIEID